MVRTLECLTIEKIVALAVESLSLVNPKVQLGNENPSYILLIIKGSTLASISSCLQQ
jgi:hypothetical protein